ncbi:MAG: hypothetical protein HXX08_05370 [Chloroflexi bacterium]|uniref:Uncharacterized protein n=1 Tax=Candidatus Chlorohelix allophototropha TaxID=3003348 RepID=A0A8T7M155_9CHLR|nr:hypothetical protein [Chloroflexota bacterium]WJW67166.1 hypothetical protein OZ401_000422 [Chloroflexota bacterium L227-S17]
MKPEGLYLAPLNKGWQLTGLYEGSKEVFAKFSTSVGFPVIKLLSSVLAHDYTNIGFLVSTGSEKIPERIKTMKPNSLLLHRLDTGWQVFAVYPTRRQQIMALYEPLELSLARKIAGIIAVNYGLSNFEED